MTETDHTLLNVNTDGRFKVSLSAVMDSAFLQAVIYDAQGTVLFVNRQFEQGTGLSGADIIGKPIRVIGDIPGENAYYRALCRAMERDGGWQGKVACTTRGEDRVYDTSISPIREDTGRGLVFLAVRRDVTELALREKRLHQAGKMEAIGTLAGGIAHDFNNILAGIVGYAELVKEDLEALEDARPQTHTRLDNMISGAMRAKKLIHQILVFSRSGQESMSPVSAAHLIKEVVQLLRASLPATIRIDLAIGAEGIRVLAEPTQIHQIMMNLCANARDAMMNTGGVLSISLTETRRSKGQGKKHLRLRVADTGSGIDPGIRHKVMDPFFTTKPLEKGTGMGLSVVHGIVAGLGGEIEISDNSPHGAVFDIFLPLYTGSRSEVDEAAEARPPARGNKECIVFVDDEADLIDIAVDGLSNAGYRVIGFDDSQRALTWLKENPDIPDLVISDVIMPDLTGDLLVQKIRQFRQDLPVVLITGASERLNEEKARELGADALLQKPMILGEMAAAVRQALDRRDDGRNSDH